jgi:hypothetical protein
MPRLARQNNPLESVASIDPRAGMGVNTTQRDDDDSLDVGEPMDVISVNRARRWDNAELTRVDDDLVGTGRRMDVQARSGNDAHDMEDDDELDDQEFTQVGMGEDPPAQGMSPGMKLAVFLAFGGLFFALTRR